MNGIVIENFDIKYFDELCKLQKLYKRAIGEEILENFDFNSLKTAIRNKQIEFYVVREDKKLIAMCSISKTFSIFINQMTIRC